MAKKFTINPPREVAEQSDEAPRLNGALNIDPVLNAGWLRSFPQCGHYTDKRAAQIIAVLSAFGKLLIDVTFFAHQLDSPQEDKATEPVKPTRIIPLKPKNKKAA